MREGIETVESNLHANNQNSLMLIEGELLEVSQMLLLAGVKVESVSKCGEAGKFRMVMARFEEAMRAIENFQIAKMSLK